MDLIWILVIVQTLAAILHRWIGMALFAYGPEPAFGNLPMILMANPKLLKYSLIIPNLVALTVVVIGFIHVDSPWWLTGYVIASLVWASPPYRS